MCTRYYLSVAVEREQQRLSPTYLVCAVGPGAECLHLCDELVCEAFGDDGEPEDVGAGLLRHEALLQAQRVVLVQVTLLPVIPNGLMLLCTYIYRQGSAKSRDGISDETGQDLEAGYPLAYSVILSQL